MGYELSVIGWLSVMSKTENRKQKTENRKQRTDKQKKL
jgi:hypothetical protein